MTNRNDYVLAVMAADTGAKFSPVQLQKLFFLLDKKIAGRFGAPHFKFQPYNYGPFDADVYRAVEELEAAGRAKIVRPEFGPREFMLTEAGVSAGAAVLSGVSEPMRDYLASLSKYVRSMTFQQLVSSVYREFPEMRERSVFRET